ncbi:hypothetical protein LXL04_012570 [Taraxacum kok-saghyz]
MLPTEEKWTQVQRRKHPATNTGGRRTNFYVTNIPQGATKAEFTSIFSSFGKLVDIYFGEKKGRNGKNFGFIRFEGVEDEKQLEQKLNSAKCRSNYFEVNIERHRRKDPQTDKRQGDAARTRQPGTANTTSTHVGGFRDQRSYAEAMGKKTQRGGGLPNQVPQPGPHERTIHLEADGLMCLWLNTKTMYGQLRSTL